MGGNRHQVVTGRLHHGGHLLELLRLRCRPLPLHHRLDRRESVPPNLLSSYSLAFCQFLFYDNFLALVCDAGQVAALDGHGGEVKQGQVGTGLEEPVGSVCRRNGNSSRPEIPSGLNYIKNCHIL